VSGENRRLGAESTQLLTNPYPTGAPDYEEERDLNRVLDELAKESVVFWLHTRSEAGDRLHRGLERLRKNHYHLWAVRHELYLAEDADPSNATAKLEAWRQAPEGSQEWRKAHQHDEAIEILLVATKR
jgi:hypothetical protein